MNTMLPRVLKEQPLILGIESSCDETAAAVISGRRLFSRAHTDAVDLVVERALKAAGVKKEQLDAVAVTYGAGLLGALLVGLSFAKGLLRPPFVTLLASGGHTAVIYTKSALQFEVLGGTLDDAAGEAFDKVARVLGLPYPGGPHIEALAREGSPVVHMPKMLKGEGGYNFSYSGLKTAVINYCHTMEQRGEVWSRADVAASFQSAALDILVQKTVEGALEKNVTTVTAGGGVIANGYLREQLSKACKAHGLRLVLPVKKHCTDNAAMIAAEGLIQYEAGNFSPLSLNACASIPLR